MEGALKLVTSRRRGHTRIFSLLLYFPERPLRDQVAVVQFELNFTWLCCCLSPFKHSPAGSHFCKEVVLVSHPGQKEEGRICWLVSAVLGSSAGEQNACWKKRGWSWVRRLRDDCSGHRPGSSILDAGGVGVECYGAVGRSRRCRGVPHSLQLPEQHGGLPWPGDPHCAQKHPQRH